MAQSGRSSTLSLSVKEISVSVAHAFGDIIYYENRAQGTAD